MVVEHVTVSAGGQAIVGAVGGGMMESDGNPMHPAFRLNTAPRCSAVAHRTSTRCNRLPSRAARYAECTVQAAAHLQGQETACESTAGAAMKLPTFAGGVQN